MNHSELDVLPKSFLYKSMARGRSQPHVKENKEEVYFMSAGVKNDGIALARKLMTATAKIVLTRSATPCQKTDINSNNDHLLYSEQSSAEQLNRACDPPQRKRIQTFGQLVY